MITLSTEDLMAISMSIGHRIDLYKKLADYNDYYPKRVKELEGLRAKINEAREQTLERQSIRIACKL